MELPQARFRQRLSRIVLESEKASSLSTHVTYKEAELGHGLDATFWSSPRLRNYSIWCLCLPGVHSLLPKGQNVHGGHHMAHVPGAGLVPNLSVGRYTFVRQMSYF